MLWKRTITLTKRNWFPPQFKKDFMEWKGTIALAKRSLIFVLQHKPQYEKDSFFTKRPPRCENGQYFSDLHHAMLTTKQETALRWWNRHQALDIDSVSTDSSPYDGLEMHTQKLFSNNIFKSIRPIQVQTKVHYTIFRLFVVTFDMLLTLCFTCGLDRSR